MPLEFQLTDAQRLEMQFPRAWPASVAASAVSADEQPPRSAVVAFSVQSPPAANTLHGEFGRVMRYSNVDHGPIPRYVVGAVWNSLALP